MNPQRKKISAIIFDYDDTLVRTREIRYGTIQRIGRQVFGAEISVNEIDAAWGIPGDAFLLRLMGRFLGTDVAAMWRLYNEFCEQDLNQLHTGVADSLETLSEKFPLGILTSSSSQRVLAEFENLPLATALFQKIQTAEATTVHKPNPQVFRPIVEHFEQSGIFRNEILYVGDSLADFAASTGFGLQFVGMAHSSREQRAFEGRGIRYCDSFAALGRLF